MIKLINLLYEVNELPPIGEKIGSGGSSTAYAHPTDPDKIVKIYSGKYVEDFTRRVEFFKKYPKYFPKVYEYGDRYVIEDKLDNKPIKQLNATLNSLANNQILNNHYFKKVFIPYAPGDAGGCIGSALVTFRKKNKKDNFKNITTPFIGSSYSSEYIKK